jgi:hypothetical protein
MNQIVLDRFISSDRLSVYSGLDEYERNLKSSKEHYIPLSIFEVALRNSIDHHLSQAIGIDWINDDTFLQRESISFRDEAKAKLLKRRELATKSKIVAELSFGFWISIFKLPYKKHWRTKDLKNIFPNMPPLNIAVVNRDIIYSDLDLIRKFRNRLFHHEKIINKPAYVNINQTINRLLSYLDADLKLFTDKVNG